MQVAMMVPMTDNGPETEDERYQRIVTERLVRPLPKRFYKVASVSETNGILLDGRTVKTPLKSTLILPNAQLAAAVAAEWQAQDKLINPAFMPLTKLANTAIDRASHERSSVVKEIVDYAGNDLVCYWAATPPTLVDKQRSHWQPIVDWVEAALGATFKIARGISHVPQSAAALSAVHGFAEAQDQWRLTAFFLLTTLTGSALLSAQLLAGSATPDAVWSAAHVDEDYQIEHWGLDWEAEQRRTSRRREFDGLVRFLDLLEDRQLR
jgi:chaperone required for assembly of F1-ATPase